ncbi:MAG: GHKL domain-containing protein [Eubacteriales bacterium]
MKPWKKIGLILLAILLVTPLLYLYSTALQFGFWGTWTQRPVQTLTHVTMERGGATTDISLPLTLTDGTPGESVVLTAQIENAPLERLYLKSVYAPLQVYLNNQLLYDYGDDGNYPTYLKDPPMMVVMLDLPDENPMTLRLEYTYPTARGDLILEPPLVGSYPAIFTQLLSQNENLLFLYTFFLTFGLLLLCIGLFVRSFERLGHAVIWMGLVITCCGLWGIGEYDITGIFIQNESLLYVMAFTGAFYLPVPLHFYFRSVVGYHNPRPITICGFSTLFAAVSASALQCLGVASFFNMMPVYIALTIVSFFFALAYTVYEWQRHGNKLAKRFAILWCILIASILLELFRVFRGTINAYGLFIQLGLVAFILGNCFIGGFLIRQTVALREQNRRMEQEYKFMESQVTEQQRYHHLLLETRQILRQQRHDLRHQLAAIRDYAKEGNWEKLSPHLDSLHTQIPEESPSYCENIAVNAVVTHFVAKAKADGVKVTIQLMVPESAQRIRDNNLCIIFGNIVENAMEACGRMNGSGKFITLTSYIRNGMLVITQENSFEGPIRQTDGKFYSSKREEFGIGLSSVQFVARKHGGNATFTPEDNIFHSAIYVRI